GMTVCTNTTPLEIVDGGGMVKFKGKVRKIEADTVVYAFGAAAQHALYDELKGSGKEVYLVGDAKGPAKIMDAIYTAYKLSIKL
ncbi:MAG: 2-enoate reductase, partial [Oscillospiraceae bacterium]|nr:2-enoate reductase [Oscillospiraceae bacterium]